LGCTTELTDELSEQLFRLGKDCGSIFERKRRLDTMKKLKSDLNKSGLRPDDICTLACNALIATIRGLKEASFIGAIDPEEFKHNSNYDSIPTFPQLNFNEAEALVKKVPTGKQISKQGSLSLAGVVTISSGVDRGYLNPPEKVKRRINTDATNGSPEKKTESESVLRYRREKTIEDRATVLRPPGSCSSIVCIPDGVIQEWVTLELWLPSGFQFSNSKAKFSSHIFAAVLRTNNVSESSATEDNGCFKDICEMTSQALKIYWEKDLRKRFRKQITNEVEARIAELKEMEIPGLIDFILESIQRVAPGVAM
jgi:hypothetical protein